MNVSLTPQDELDRYRRLRMAIAEGDADYDRGEEVQFTSSLVEDMKQDAERLAQDNVAPDPEVCPKTDSPYIAVHIG